MATDVTPPPPPRPTEASSAVTSEPEPDVIHIPSYSRWFSWNVIHESEVKYVPEFFDGRSPAKNPRVYKYYRNAIIRRFRDNPSRKITFTEVRKTIVGDVGSVRRVFDFLESWGLINYTGSNFKPQIKWEDKDAKLAQSGEAVASSNNAGVAVPKKRVCSGCKTHCTIACFASDKHDMTLCARCYVRGNYRVGLSSSDFKRVEIGEEAKTDWNEKETLQLVEAIMHYADDWKKVAELVGGRSVKDCVARFIKLPFGEQYNGPPESGELNSDLGLQNGDMPNKKMRLSPLADASNPIMAQAAFLSTLVGVNVAEVAAGAAVKALSDFGSTNHNESDKASNGDTQNTFVEALAEAKSQIEREEDELEKAISGIAAETKEIEDKVLHLEEYDLQMEGVRRQVQQMQNQLFTNQITLLHRRTATGETKGESVVIVE